MKPFGSEVIDSTEVEGLDSSRHDSKSGATFRVEEGGTGEGGVVVMVPPWPCPHGALCFPATRTSPSAAAAASAAVAVGTTAGAHTVLLAIAPMGRLVQ